MRGGLSGPAEIFDRSALAELRSTTCSLEAVLSELFARSP